MKNSLTVKEEWLHKFLESGESARNFAKHPDCHFNYRQLNRLRKEYLETGVILPDLRTLCRKKSRPVFSNLALCLCRLVLDQGIVKRPEYLIQYLLGLAEEVLEIEVGVVPCLKTIRYYLGRIKDQSEIVDSDKQFLDNAKLLFEAFVLQKIEELYRCWGIDTQQYTIGDQQNTGLYIGGKKYIKEPWIIRVVDLCSRLLLAQLVCWEKPTPGDVIAAIHYAALRASSKPGHASLSDYIRIDRGGENLPLIYRSGITFRFIQFTPQATPTLNGTVENKHDTLTHDFIPKGLKLPRIVSSDEFIALVERGGILNSKHLNQAFQKKLTPDQASRNYPIAGSQLLREELDQISYVIHGPFSVHDAELYFRGKRFLIPDINKVLIHEYVAGSLIGTLMFWDAENMIPIAKEGISCENSD